MAIAAFPFEIGARVTVAAVGGVPASTGNVVAVINDFVDGTGWLVTVRVPDDLRGTVDYMVPHGSVTAA